MLGGRGGGRSGVGSCACGPGTGRSKCRQRGGRAELVPEDLVIMRRNDARSGEYAAVAAAVFFSFGDLPKRIAKQYSMDELHAKVDNFDAHLGEATSRFLEKLTPERPAWRSNWWLSFTPLLEPVPDRYLLNLEKRKRIFPHAALTEWDGPDGALRRFERDGVGNTIFVKVEYQTFRRLATHDDCILFAVHTHMEPLHALAHMPSAAAALLANLRLTSELDFRHYKGLSDDRIFSKVVDYIERLREGKTHVALASRSLVVGGQRTALGSMSDE